MVFRFEWNSSILLDLYGVERWLVGLDKGGGRGGVELFFMTILTFQNVRKYQKIIETISQAI